MAINIKNFNGRTLKKVFNAKRAAFQYHNKNNSGGNFAINIIFEDRPTSRQFHGEYTTEGFIYSLQFNGLDIRSQIPSIKIPIWALENMNTLLSYIRVQENWNNGLGESSSIRESELLSKREQVALIGITKR